MEENPVPAPTNSKRNLSIIFLIIVILAALALGSYYLYRISTPQPDDSKNNVSSTSPQPNQTTKDPTEGWQTFINEDYGYQIKYQGNWFVKTYADIPNRTLFDDVQLPESQISESEPVAAEIEVFVTEEKDIVQEKEKLKMAHQFSNYKESQVKVGGVDATKIEGKVEGESYIKGNFYTRVFVNAGNRSYSLIYSEVDQKDLEVFNKMVTSFKFL
ncbi:MAG TPA: PsbP-related protein [Candidatus Nanoarchaeia archaeon]|nr:hypothetical protein [uncultured archaeon]